MPKCKICGVSKDASQMIKIKNRIYVCSDECKVKYESKDKPKTSERRECTDYIKSIYDGDSSYWRMIGAQLENLKTRYGFTYKGVELTLRYMVEHEEITPTDHILGLVPYYYERTKNDYINTLEINEAFSSYESDECIEIIHTTQKKNRKPQIDLRRGL